MTEIEQLQAQLNEERQARIKLHEQFLILQDTVSKSTRSEPAGTSTVGELTQITAEQLDADPSLYIEHPDGGLRANLSQITTKAREELPAENLTGTINTGRLPTIPKEKIPAANNSSTAATGFGGFRYTVSGSMLNLYTS